MVIRTIRTSKDEADRILDGDVNFVFRSNSDHIRVGDVIQFLVYKDTKPVIHRIDAHHYIVTVVRDGRLAPIESGWQIIGFKKAA